MRWAITDFCDASLDLSWFRWVERRKGPITLITKDPGSILKKFPNLLNEQVILHATITGYGGSFLEPNVRDPSEVLSEVPVHPKVVIRIDPIVPLPEFVSQSERVYQKAKELGHERVRVSILDLYPHVLKRLEKFSALSYELKQIYSWDLSHSLGDDRDYMHHCDLQLRRRILARFQGAEVCCEPGLRCSGCVSLRDLKVLGIDPKEAAKPEELQRKFCSCLEKTEIGRLKDPCAFGCLYCFKV
jgi:DNA repair photolyase